ncbi:MAG: phytoene desaturase family protein [Candidatus Hermodarchaeota archaeon]
MSEKNLEQSFSESYDAVVIGAGNGGLVAATQLAKQGVKVLLLEQHNVPGGFATSFVRGRFEFEPSMHVLAAFGKPPNMGPVRSIFEDEFNLDLEFFSVPEAFRAISLNPNENFDVVMPFGVEETIDKIEKEVPGSRESVTLFIRLCKEVSDAISYIAQSKGNPDRKLLMKEYGNFLRTVPYSLGEVIDTFDIPKKAKDILSAYWVYLGPPVSRCGFTIYATMLYNLLLQGGYVPKYRSHGYTSALDLKIRELGGRIEYNTKATRILVENGQVIGVETSKGDKIKTNYVVSNASPTLVYNKLVYPKEEVPEIAYKQVNARTHGTAGFVVYLGLDASAEELGLTEYSYFIFDTLDTEESYESFGILEAPKAQAAMVLNLTVPDCSPPGTCIVSLTSLFQPEVWANVKEEEYFKLKSKIADQLIAKFEKAVGTSIRDHIEEIEIATPETWARYTGTYNGIIYGYEPDPWDSVIPRMMTMEEEFYIKGLKFCGGFSFQSHGYSTSLISGNIAALLTVRDIKEGGKEE